MPAYSQGGGGGRAGETSTDQFAFDQPFEIGNTFTAETAAQINEMFQILFKAQARAQTRIDTLDAAPAVAASDVLIATINLSNAQIAVLNTTPVINVAGVAGKIIVPIWWELEWETTVVYGSAPNWTLRPTGVVADVFLTSTSRLNEVRHINQVMTYTTGGYIDNTADDLVGTGLEISFSANPTPAAGASATAVSKIGYHLIDTAYP